MSAHELPNAGDMAYVVRVCECGRDDGSLGTVVGVVALKACADAYCPQCGREYHDEIAYLEGAEPGAAFLRSWLQRIKPLSELTPIERRVEMPA